MSEELKYKAIAYWQDRLGKFFPTSKGPTNVEIEMFEAGYNLREQEIERLREALQKITKFSKSDFLGKWVSEYDLQEIAREALKNK